MDAPGTYLKNELEILTAEEKPLKYLDNEGNYENDIDKKFAYIMGKALGKQDYYKFSFKRIIC